MQNTSFLTAGYLDIMFLNRNKSYGAYELRSNYHIRACKSMTVIVFAVLLLFLFSFHKTNVADHSLTTTPTICELPVKLTYFPVPKPKPITPAQATSKAVVKRTTFIVTKDNDVHEKVSGNKELEHKQTGTQNIEGESTDSDEGTTATKKGESVDTRETGEIIAPATPLTYTSVMPDFEGNLKEYLSKKLKYPEFAKENDVQGRVTVQFVVNEDGSISNARVLRGIGGGCDEEALRVVKNMPKWKPGMHNGKAVKVYMNLPIVFQLH